jgi:hypothetical protein
MIPRVFRPVFFSVLASAFVVPSAAAQSVGEELWVPNGPVHAIAATDQTIYIGGVFTHVGPATGRLPPTFALTAGWGDIFVAATALPLAWAIHRRAAGWRPLALAWNAVAALDLVVAVSLGIGSAPDSPVRFIFESPDSGAATTLPG